MSIEIKANPTSAGSVTGGLTYKGSYNVTTNTPDLTSSVKGDFYIVSTGGTLAGVTLNVGDHIVFNQDASSPINSAMFDVIDNTDAVASVNGLTGPVVLNLKTINDVNATLTPTDSTFLVGDGSEWIGESGATARTSLGLTIGTNVQAYDAQLDDIAGLTPTDSHIIIGNGSNFVTESGATARTSLGVAIGSDVQAHDAQLDDIAGLTPADGAFIVGDGSNFVTESGATARTSLGLTIGTNVQAHDAQLDDIAGLTPTDSHIIIGDGSNFVTESGATARTSLGLAIGSDVQAHDAQLDDIAGLTPTDSNFIVGDGSNFVLESGLTARTSLGCGSAATFDAGANSANQLVQLTAAGKLPAVDGSLLTNLPGGGDLLASNNLSDLANVGTARTNLGLVIGTNVQAYDAQLDDVAGLTPTDGHIIIGNGSNFVTESGATARTSLGVSIGSDVQAYDAQLADIAGLTPTDSHIIVGDGSNFVTESGATARTSLGLTIGTDVQAYDAQLADIAGLTPTDSNFIVGDGSNFVLESGLTARTSLGCGSAATFDAGANSANQLVQLTAAGKLPAVDGSLLTNLPSGGGTRPTVTSITAATYTIGTTDGAIGASELERVYTCSSSAATVNLPSSSGLTGFKLQVKNLLASTITIDPDGTEQIDSGGAGTAITLTVQYESVTLCSDGTGWIII
ncbi:MAG: putative fiber protein [Prokaryotic dsDNA virus sp.]|nr:MAG: putative fiber protein [Prokaryotic dsDNA virus sp.]